ncbi:multiple sugar transport system permease protein [Clostridium amylolyticum]|uniref:Multiple sugar transport system permease protein n=1 Tax=Clostridium amylolyticum TaxID=1121298 RepID=A0A1M6BZN1_9CLOT|nr:carbohydrate ABC transporter permease [Clostridium amylolyticum]SHI53934.1 multiple sugar transport system permease protein [Clostridium amylolyticum]
MKNKFKFTPAGIIFNIIIWILTILFLFPFYWIVTGAFKPQNVTVQIPPEWFPKNPTFENFITLAKNPLFQWTFNSFFIAFCTMLVVCLTATMAGYALAKKKFPGRNLIFWSLIVAMALPKQVVMIPLFTILSKLNWINSYQALILPAAAWPFGVFLMKQFSQGVPGELLEAARIDGCSELRTFVSIVVPLVKPGVGALAIFTFISSWNDYFMQLIVIRSSNKLTLPLGIALMQQEFTTNYGAIMAGAALASLPMIIIFIAFQKYFTQGITMGAVKG